MALSGPVAGTDSFLERDWRVPPEMLFSCRGFRGFGGAKVGLVHPCFFNRESLLDGFSMIFFNVFIFNHFFELFWVAF